MFTQRLIRTTKLTGKARQLTGQARQVAGKTRQMARKTRQLTGKAQTTSQTTVDNRSFVAGMGTGFVLTSSFFQFFHFFHNTELQEKLQEKLQEREKLIKIERKTAHLFRESVRLIDEQLAREKKQLLQKQLTREKQKLNQIL